MISTLKLIFKKTTMATTKKSASNTMATFTPYALTISPLNAIPTAKVNDQIMECTSLAFCKAMPESSLGSNDISVEKNIEALAIRINIKIINNHKSDLSLMVKNSKVMASSVHKSVNISGFILNLSIITPEKGAMITAGIKCMAATTEMAKSDEPNCTSMV